MKHRSILSGIKLGACALLAGVLTFTASAAQVAAIYHFTNGPDGAGPWAGLVEASDGNFYGTATAGGLNGNGTVFRITKAGILTTLHSFNGTNGAMPSAGLIQARDGNLYGTTSGGGLFPGLGTVFRCSPGGVFTPLHFFGFTNGAFPNGGLTEATNGWLYGTTFGGKLGHGSVFRISTNGQFTTLYSFTNGLDGANPEKVALLQARDGHLYGTASKGGAHGFGTLYRITLAGDFKPVYSFTGGADGSKPVAGLIEGRDGNLYGTASQRGAANFGTTYRITRAGAFTLLHAFTNRVDGRYPISNLIEMSDGWFYGTTQSDGINPRGTIFGVNAAGDFKVVSGLTDATGGNCAPGIGLVHGGDGNLYGTAPAAGATGYGTVFRVTGVPGPPAPIRLQPGRTAGGQLVFNFSTAINLTYAVEMATNLAAPQWLIVTNVSGSGGEFQWTAPASPLPAAFYRVRQF